MLSDSNTDGNTRIFSRRILPPAVSNVISNLYSIDNDECDFIYSYSSSSSMAQPPNSQDLLRLEVSITLGRTPSDKRSARRTEIST